MKVFHCGHCGHVLFFENSQCVSCGYGVAYLPDERTMTAFPSGEADSRLAPAESGGGAPVRRCHNDVEFDVCNWAIAGEDPQLLCRSCRLTRVIPDVSRPEMRLAWYKLETAKRRLLFTLMALRLPIVSRDEDAEAGLAFEFLADVEGADTAPVLTGHGGGVITINVAEADDAERERRRLGLGEPYRTLLGHMRHESGHYYWDRLIRDTDDLEPCRALFGDESIDYDQSLRAYYEQGPASDWQSRFVSAYASSHPWEDWAETWAHYLHMVDALETAAQNGVGLRPRRSDEPTLKPLAPDVAASGVEFDRLIERWFPLTYLLNNLNRGLGLQDGYPFVLSTAAIEKLRFVHDLVGRRGGAHAEPMF